MLPHWSFGFGDDTLNCINCVFGQYLTWDLICCSFCGDLDLAYLFELDMSSASYVGSYYNYNYYSLCSFLFQLGIYLVGTIATV